MVHNSHVNRTNGKRVLVVDDVPGILRMLRINLNLHGYEVLTASSGAEAIDLAKKENPDIVLLDILMPGLSGYDVIKELKAFSKVPILVITASSSFIDKAIETGADDALPKPFEPEDIIEKIEALLGEASDNPPKGVS